jgi:hypothetical protein
MKKLFLILAAVPMAALAGEASAQTYANANAGGGVGVQNRIANLEARFNAGLSAGVFTNSERSTIGRQLTDLRNLERSYSANGLSAAERRTLQQRIRTVRDQLRVAGGTNWANRYGWSDTELDTHAGAYGNVSYDAYGRPIPNGNVAYDRYGRPVANNGTVYDQYGRPVANNGAVYDQYGRPVADNRVVYDRYGRPVADDNVVYDRNGRPISNGGYGQGGPYEPAQQSRGVGGVLGGVLGNVMGGGGGVGGILGSVLGNGGLRTGDVITGAIGSVLGSAAGMGSRFRDNNNVYYRSDGQRVYEVDARSNTVLRVHPLQQ